MRLNGYQKQLIMDNNNVRHCTLARLIGCPPAYIKNYRKAHNLHSDNRHRGLN